MPKFSGLVVAFIFLFLIIKKKTLIQIRKNTKVFFKLWYLHALAEFAPARIQIFPLFEFDPRSVPLRHPFFSFSIKNQIVLHCHVWNMWKNVLLKVISVHLLDVQFLITSVFLLGFILSFLIENRTDEKTQHDYVT